MRVVEIDRLLTTTHHVARVRSWCTRGKILVTSINGGGHSPLSVPSEARLHVPTRLTHLRIEKEKQKSIRFLLLGQHEGALFVDEGPVIGKRLFTQPSSSTPLCDVYTQAP